MGLRFSEKSVLPTSFGHGRFQENSYSFKSRKWLKKTLFAVR